MQQLYKIFYLLFVVLASTLLACSDKQKPDDPTPTDALLGKWLFEGQKLTSYAPNNTLLGTTYTPRGLGKGLWYDYWVINPTEIVLYDIAHPGVVFHRRPYTRTGDVVAIPTEQYEYKILELGEHKLRLQFTLPEYFPEYTKDNTHLVRIRVFEESFTR